MPIYEYECTSCHHQFDRLQKISDVPLKLCPKCQEDTAVRLVSAAGFQLKGTGWYASDFKNTTKTECKTTSSDASATNVKSTSTGEKT